VFNQSLGRCPTFQERVRGDMIKKVTFKIDEFELSELDFYVERIKSTRSMVIRDAINGIITSERPDTIKNFDKAISEIRKNVLQLVRDKEELNKSKEGMKRLREEVSKLKQVHDEELNKLKQAHSGELSKVKQAYNAEINKLKVELSNSQQINEKLRRIINNGVLEIEDVNYFCASMFDTKKTIVDKANEKIRERIHIKKSQ